MRDRGVGRHEKHEAGGEKESCQCSLLDTPRPHRKSPLKLALKTPGRRRGFPSCENF
jgi:hypothetical protein